LGNIRQFEEGANCGERVLLKKCWVVQLALHRSSPRSAQREAVYKDINNNNLDIFKQRAYKISFLIKAKSVVKGAVKRALPQSAVQGYKALKRRHSQDKSRGS
jgi:hypothetical protein